jgi:hypothetical protein
MQIDQWLAHIPRNRMCLILSEDLRDRRAATMGKVYDFLGVDNSWNPPPVDYHTSEQTRTRRPSVRRIQGSTFMRPLLRRIPSSLKQRGKTRLTYVADRPVAASTTVLDEELASVLRTLLRPDVEALVPHMPPGFDGWGIARPR